FRSNNIPFLAECLRHQLAPVSGIGFFFQADHPHHTGKGLKDRFQQRTASDRDFRIGIGFVQMIQRAGRQNAIAKVGRGNKQDFHIQETAKARKRNSSTSPWQKTRICIILLLVLLSFSLPCVMAPTPMTSETITPSSAKPARIRKRVASGVMVWFPWGATCFVNNSNIGADAPNGKAYHVRTPHA